MQRAWTAEDLSLVEGRLGLLVPQDIAIVLLTEPLVGMGLILDDRADPSGMGVEMQWMSAEQAVDEGANYYPGILAVKAGYLPIGLCLKGSGDPYFVRLRDGVVLRIPHDAVGSDGLRERGIEVVGKSLTALARSATIKDGVVKAK